MQPFELPDLYWHHRMLSLDVSEQAAYADRGRMAGSSPPLSPYRNDNNPE